MIRHSIFKIDKDDGIWAEKTGQTFAGLSWVFALGKHMGPDIILFIKVVINVLCLSSVALPYVFCFVVFSPLSC